MGTRVDCFHFCLSFAAVEDIGRRLLQSKKNPPDFGGTEILKGLRLSERAASSKIRSGRSECAHLGGNSLVPLV